MKIFETANRRHILKKTSPVLTGYFFLGVGFGILLEESGYGLLEAFLMSLLIYSGSMQYAAISLFNTGASLLTAFLSTIVVNARYFFYSLSLIKTYEHAGKRKPYLIHSIVDEAYALVNENDHDEKISDEDYYLGVNLYDHFYWIISTMIGVLIGNMISFEIKGIDFVMSALFITLYVDQWLKNRDHIPSLAGILVPAACLFLFGSDSFLIISIIALSVFSAVYKGGRMS